MKFTLKDYQDDAVAQVLDRLKKARKRWHEDGEKNAFSLTATTGAGKTVMAAAVFEALFFGSDDYEFEPDPGAVVIWFSDDPSLNSLRMACWRMQASRHIRICMVSWTLRGQPLLRRLPRPGRTFSRSRARRSRRTLKPRR